MVAAGRIEDANQTIHQPNVGLIAFDCIAWDKHACYCQLIFERCAICSVGNLAYDLWSSLT